MPSGVRTELVVLPRMLCQSFLVKFMLWICFCGELLQCESTFGEVAGVESLEEPESLAEGLLVGAVGEVI